MLYHDVRCSLTLNYTLRNKNEMLKMMMKVMLLTCDRLSGERGLCISVHINSSKNVCLLLYAISSLCLYTRPASSTLLLPRFFVVLMCIKRGISAHATICIISACHKS